MAKERLTRLAASTAWDELQEAYGLIYAPTDDDQKPDLEKAEKHLKRVNDWLLALRAE